MEKKKINIEFEPIGKRITATKGKTLLEIALDAGIALKAVCGGAGTCGKCQIQITRDLLPEPNLIEKSFFSAEALDKGWRLACQTVVDDSMKVYIPPESISTPQRLQLEGINKKIHVESSIKIYDLDIPINNKSNEEIQSVFAKTLLSLPGQISVSQQEWVPEIISMVKNENGNIRVICRKNNFIACLAEKEPVFGLAVDLGTTKIAAYLVNLESNDIAAQASAMNPQINYGEDVISRILYCMENKDGRKLMQEKVIKTLNSLIQTMCKNLPIQNSNIIQAVVVGNTLMHHLFTGLPVKQLGLSPFLPAVKHAMKLNAKKLGLSISPMAEVYTPENVAGYVGGDHVAMMMAIAASENNDSIIALDIGTNTEISLVHQGNLYSCSCASGPTFEGAHIHEGMRAAEGAIESIKIENDRVYYQTIGDKPAIGICGSGILDAISEMRKNNIINSRGRFNPDNKNLINNGNSSGYILVPEEQSGCDHSLIITKKDVNEVLLAKAAIQTGIEILLQTAGITSKEVDQFILAGAFGTYIDLKSAIQIGMLPDHSIDKFSQVGNAAGSGARMLLISDQIREKATEFANHTNYIELTSYPGFQKIYLKSLQFPNYF